MRSFAVFLCIAMLGAASPSPAPNADQQYEALARAYFADNFRTQPIGATFTGVHTYDAQLGDFSAAAVARQLATDRQYLNRLASIDAKQLSPEVALDARLFSDNLKDDLLLNGQLAQWRHNPDNYVGLASGAIFGLLSRNYAPLSTRMRYAIAREQQIPRMLRQAKEVTTTVDAATKAVSAQDAAGSVSFFKQTVPLGFAAVKDGKLQSQLRSANAAASAAMESFAAWIGSIKPSGTYALGPAAYRKRLLYEMAVDMPLDQYLSIGKRALAQTKARFIATAKQIDPRKSPQAVFASLYRVHPPAAALLPTAQNDLKRLRAFVIAHHIITLPADANIKVIDTPPFQRATTEAAEDSPGPLETVATQAYYYVTPVDPSWTRKQKEEFLGLFNDFTRPIISAHEVYPGHFTNFTIDRHLNLSLSRRLLTSPATVEGWAHYDEQMMVDEGWGNHDPRVRLAQLGEALLREARYVVGVKEHTQGMSVDAATKFFMDNAFETRQVAHGEALRGTQDPMYGYYTLGKLEILKLRADYRKMLGSAFTLQKFHDALLAHGDPPIPLLRPILLGKSDDGRIL
ncbi:MAG: DUF885 domain-containing protein, partial [Candidatus Eremiobacteraeota bacterium]|nr:DUF885 domain-containing protein [Candidatus Eremiobacteraeota bacterium]